MGFIDVKEKLQENFKNMTQDIEHLFEVEVDKEEMWNLYLDSFPAGTNEIFRERREHDCSCCRQFIKNIGNAVVIKNNQIHTIWDFNIDEKTYTYKPVLKALSEYIKAKAVSNIYISKFKKIGTDHDHELYEGETIRWEHFYLELPSKFVDNSGRSIGDIQGSYRDTKNVFKRSLDEISEDSVLTVLELIAQKSLYKGEEWEHALKEFLQYKKEYDKLTEETEKNNFAWEQSVKAGAVIGRIRNHSIGTLLVNISENMDLDTAVKKYEVIVAPTNYKRPKAIFTKKMLEDAKKTIEELGYLDSLKRRYATLDDITVNNILFSNKDAANRISGGDIFDDMLGEVAVNPKKFSKVEEVSVEDFVSDILPTTKEIEVLLENKHASNMVSLIAPEVADSKTMFKWDNNFGWAYSGNITDSELRNAVKMAGGRIDGALRFSHTWNYDGNNQSLMDLHVFMPDTTYKTIDTKTDEIHDNYPSGRRVGWNCRQDYASGGVQDVDFVHKPGSAVPVENITFPDINKMPEGKYIFKIHNWDLRQPTRSGFKAEIEFGGDIYSFEHAEPLKNKQWITLAEVTLKNGQFTIEEKLKPTIAPKEIWGLSSNQFVPVSVMMYSPNYWDEQEGIGHKHYFFMLKDCVNPENPNGFYNEFLKQELVEHKRVFEALGGKMAVQEVGDQLSGLGFSSTKRNELVVKVKGQTERTIKIKF